jgi:4-hydroxy-3-methylbut-2-enyl diphosphate reductase
MRIILASPHGFCAGVVRAIEALELALETHGLPLYVYHEIVHNRHVVERFRRQGVVFVNSIEEVPPGQTLMFSAHGVSPQIRGRAQERLRTMDATCPLVQKVHAEAVRFARQGYTILLIGHQGHDEIVGIMGEAPGQILLVENLQDAESVEAEDPERVAYLTQTTLSVDESKRIVDILRRRFPRIAGPKASDICYATQNRQEAVRQLAAEADLVLVVGSRNSSNTIRLAEVARECGAPAYLIDDVRDIDPTWFWDVQVGVLTAGASAPEYLVEACVAWIVEKFGASVEHRVVRRENLRFGAPVILASPEPIQNRV